MFELKKEILETFCEKDERRRKYLQEMLMTDDEGESNHFFALAQKEEAEMKAIEYSHVDAEDLYAVVIAHDFVKTLGVERLDKIIACLNVCEVEVV
ncbi:MAG: hypothetical protein IJY05_03045 [Clostridia bacterium]|nr:hypothetical protein [Clostridia bacterium]